MYSTLFKAQVLGATVKNRMGETSGRLKLKAAEGATRASEANPIYSGFIASRNAERERGRRGFVRNGKR